MSGSYVLTGKIDVELFDTSAYVRCLGLYALFVRGDLAVQADCLDRVFPADL